MPPCKESRDSPDCPNRAVGCQATCEKYLAFRAERDKLSAERKKEYIAWDYDAAAIYRKRHSLKQTDAGRKALSKR
jgi:hypothetical protein